MVTSLEIYTKSNRSNRFQIKQHNSQCHGMVPEKPVKFLNKWVDLFCTWNCVQRKININTSEREREKKLFFSLSFFANCVCSQWDKHTNAEVWTTKIHPNSDIFMSDFLHTHTPKVFENNSFARLRYFCYTVSSFLFCSKSVYIFGDSECLSFLGKVLQYQVKRFSPRLLIGTDILAKM